MTLEEIRKLKVGDYVVLAPLKVMEVDETDSDMALCVDDGRGRETGSWIHPSIVDRAGPRPLQVGDRVRFIDGSRSDRVFEVAAPERLCGPDMEVALWNLVDGYTNGFVDRLTRVED